MTFLHYAGFFLLCNSSLGSEKAAGNHQMNAAHADIDLQAK